VNYENKNKPFLDSHIFSQPYDGLADFDEHGIVIALNAAHKYNFPLWVHANGNEAQTDVLQAMETHKGTGVRDVVLHFTTPTQAQVSSIPRTRIGVTFLMNNFYYYYQPLCEQVVGASATQNLYPAG
jgi:predicted amidohydrolase YtcJ